jgi:hypothetical protein
MKRLIISGIAAAGITQTFAPMAQAEPVSDMHSESPYIEGFYRELEGLGHGYLDQAWQVNDAAWVACRVWEAPGATYYDAVAVVDARGYSYDEASAIVEAAIHNLC